MSVCVCVCVCVMKMCSDQTLVTFNCILIKQEDGCKDIKDIVGDVDIPGYPVHSSLSGISVQMCFCNEDLCNGQLSLTVSCQCSLFQWHSLALVARAVSHNRFTSEHDLQLSIMTWCQTLMYSQLSALQTTWHHFMILQLNESLHLYSTRSLSVCLCVIVHSLLANTCFSLITRC